MAAVEGWLIGATGGLERLPTVEGTDRAGTSAGWRVAVPFETGTRRLDVTVGSAFPFSAPRVTLVDGPPFLAWPHVEKGGRLCLTTESVTHATGDPVGVVVAHLDMAVRLIEACESGAIEDDLRDEVLSYWNGIANHVGPPVVSICDAGAPSRRIRAWWGAGFTLLADTDAELFDWLRNLLGPLKPRQIKAKDGVFIRLPCCLLPDEYPRTAADVLALARAACADDVLVGAAASLPDRLPVALAMDTPHGVALAAVVVPRPKGPRGLDPVTKGFAQGRPIPLGLLGARFFRPGAVGRAAVDRADAAWVHGRSRDDRFPRLRASRVVVVGCGSVGAPIAVSLAQAGVGSLTLIDGDNLASANMSRHPLGMSSWRRGKAEALRSKIAGDLPHCHPVARMARLEDVILGPAGVLEGADLIVSAIGAWSSERMLDEWHCLGGREKPVVYAWTEPRASAGHAVAVVGSEASLQQGFDATGLPHLRVTKWPTGDTKRREPACGAVFEPYGPVELGYITAMASELALDSLLGAVHSATHRVWACSRRFLDGMGGAWSPEWRSVPGFRDEGGFVRDLPWPSVVAQPGEAA